MGLSLPMTSLAMGRPLLVAFEGEVANLESVLEPSPLQLIRPIHVEDLHRIRGKGRTISEMISNMNAKLKEYFGVENSRNERK